MADHFPRPVAPASPEPRRLVAAGLITRRAGRTVTTVRTPDGGRGTISRRPREVWSPLELNTLYARTGGTVTLRQTGATVAVTLTAPGHGADPVVVTTEWEPAAHPEHVRLPVLQAAAIPTGGAR
ncbi:hypothetical protein EES44_07880 [Streptomyces sp. ADI96-15]|uniref:hypothetical protein n=1 Tax=Streptomyces sp. ADI96-15 TaxID=1522761 RepID=UPI000F557ACF|nr:hypothetical protein [Streptomyces sp. ADI96-15]RPK69040.1 hypothetical protein EES44_07880 [Streptomyces sp. ADI96-15]